jgi:hypothetical protein
MVSSVRLASLQLRVCIATCVFLLIATLPLQFINIETGKYLLIDFPLEEKGGNKYAMYYQLDPRNQTLSLRFQNRFRMPTDLIDHCIVKFINEKKEVIHFSQSQTSVSISGPRDDILVVTIDLKPTIAALSKKIQAKEPQATAESIQQNVTRMFRYDYHHLIIDLIQAPDIHRARFTGLITGSARPVEDLALDYPDRYRTE